MRRFTLLLLASLLSGAAPAEWTPPPEIAARTRLWLRLDPRFGGDEPEGAVGSVSVLARDGGTSAETSAWIAHAPGSPLYADDPVSGDVRSLVVRQALGPAWVAVGRQWTAIGGLRLETFDGATAGLTMGAISVRGRAGLERPETGPGFGDRWTLGGEAAVAAGDASATVGVLLVRSTDVAPRTRWSAAFDWAPGEWTTLRAAATADVVARALVEARVEAAARPWEPLWLRAYARRTRVDQLLDPDDLLAVFAARDLDEAGGVAEWHLTDALLVRGDGAALPDGDGYVGARWRGAVELRTAGGLYAGADGSLIFDRDGRTAEARVATRCPLWGSWFGTAEVVGVEGDHDSARVGRAGLGFEPWTGWSAYAAAEAERSDAWDRRLAGLVIFEHAVGAPPRFGGAP
jgi:hypothetical protein